MSVVRGILIGWLGIPSDGSLFFFFFFFASFCFITGFGRPLCLCPFYCAVRMYRCTVVICGLSCYEWQGLGVRVEKGMGNNRDRDGRGEKKEGRGQALQEGGILRGSAAVWPAGRLVDVLRRLLQACCLVLCGGSLRTEQAKKVYCSAVSWS